jgi:hypothetical protein
MWKNAGKSRLGRGWEFAAQKQEHKKTSKNHAFPVDKFFLASHCIHQEL